jgi:MoaA/NifB/PqqE/SkfB family radical SAM enzyme
VSETLQAYVSDANPIVEVRPYHPGFKIHWMIGKHCNFACSYCPDMWHDNHSPHKTFDELVTAWHKIIAAVEHRPNLMIDLTFMGGETTMNPDLLPFVKWIYDNHRTQIAEMGVVTNGTSTVEYYKTLSQYCTWLAFSTHSEFMNEAKFFSTVVEVDQHAKQHLCHVSVNIMDEAWNKGRIVDYIKYLQQHKIHYSLQPIKDIGKESLGIKKTNKVDFYERVTGSRL